MTCWDCKYHKPVSVAFSVCKLKKRGISCADILNGCPSFRPKTKKTEETKMTDTVRDRLLCAIGHALLLVIKRLDEEAVFGSAYTELKEVLQLTEQETDK